jgi:flavin reductase (DIM6/NTAB) family NADH-FMN oxidoreductase RutF
MRLSLASPEDPEADDLRCMQSENERLLAASDVLGRDLRDTLGCFATGVTVLTTLASDGEPIGVTISSFNAVSLNPPLILWSLACDSPRLAAFRCASHYAVNVLAANQQWVSDTFASRDDDRFGGVAVRSGLAGVPLIEGCSAWLECRNEAQYPGGDHLVFIGRVERHARSKFAEPLVFHAGRYRQLRDELGS